MRVPCSEPQVVLISRRGKISEQGGGGLISRCSRGRCSRGGEGVEPYAIAKIIILIIAHV